MALCPQLALVNPFIGSGGWGYGYGSLNPSAQVPYGALRLGPDTCDMVGDVSYRHFSGYNFDDKYVRAFSHTHLVGAGANDLGNVGLMPVRLSEESAEWNLEDFGFPPNADKAPSSNVEDKNTISTHAPLFWWSTMNKTLESGAPGRYSTYLIEPGVTVDLVALGSYSAIHHYTFDDTSSDKPGLVVDACHLAKLEFPSATGCTNATLTVLDDGATFSAHMHFHGSLSHGKMQVWIHGRISAASSESSVVSNWRGCSHATDDDATSGCKSLDVNDSMLGVGVMFGVAELNLGDATSVDVMVGLSFINESMASLNLDAALVDGYTYDDYSSAIDETWCAALSVIGEDFETLEGDSELAVLVHTAAYRTFVSPTLYSEPGATGGAYIGLDGAMYSSYQDAIDLGGCSGAGDSLSQDKEAEEGDDVNTWVNKWRQDSQTYAAQHFSDMSLWDTFRSMNPWQLFAQKPVAMGILRSMAMMTEQQGAFPHWPIGSVDSGCMYGTHGAALVMDALLVDLETSSDCGTWGESAQKVAVAVQAQLLAMATTNDTPNGRNDLQHYLDNGFVSIESTDKSATYTLAYAYDDFILGAISSQLESLNMSIIDHDEVTAAIARGSNFGNVWSKENSFFCPRSNNGTDGNGELLCPANPAAPLIDKQWYTEGDAYHYAYYAFQDIPGLIELYDSPEAFDAALLNIFVKSLDHPFGEPVPNEYYWAGNEHDILYPWFFNFGPNCSHTQEWTRKITHLHYNTSPHGIPGNDDYGAMSSWLLWASLGIHPLPGASTFFIGSPRVSKATVYLTQLTGDQVDGSVSLSIVTYNNSDVNVFVKDLFVDGVAITTPFLERSQIENGALLEFHMTSDPMEGGLC